MLVRKYKDMLNNKSVIRSLSEFATARGRKSDMRMCLITAWEIRLCLCRRNLQR